MIEPFQQQFKEMKIKIRTVFELSLPEKIKVLYLDWEVYGMLLVTIIGGMLSISNY